MTAFRAPRRAGTSRQKSERPKTRNLIRWNEDLDKKMLLTFQWACNKRQIKLPWDLITKEMSTTLKTDKDLTDGAIVQHLAKLRAKMVQQGLSVPPPLSRGGNGNFPATARAAQGSATAGSSNARNTRRKANSKGKKFKSEDSSEEEAAAAETDSDLETVVRKKRSAKTARKTKGSSNGQIASNGTKDNGGSGSEFDDVKQEQTSSTEDGDGQTRYGVGDSMWGGLYGIEEPVGERARTLSGTPQSPTKVVVLGRISREGFAKLGIYGQVEDSEARDEESQHDSDDSEHSNDEFGEDVSSTDEAADDGAGMSVASDNGHSSYGHKTLGFNQAATPGYHGGHLGSVGHDSLNGNVLHAASLYDEGVQGLPPMIPPLFGEMSHSIQGRAGHGLLETDVTNSGYGGKYPNKWRSGGLLPELEHSYDSSYSSMDDYQQLGGLDPMVSGEEFDPNHGADWDSFLAPDHLGLDYY
ncbi:MAG: hypothetical protein Q9169_007609 [Polycauliona sp. 2 TL-2023]